MSDQLDEALGIKSANSRPQGTDNSLPLEIRFPDGTCSRYPSEVVKNLISQGRIQSDWSARADGTEEWSTVASAMTNTSNQSTTRTQADRPAKATNPQSEKEEILASIGQRSLVGLLKGEGLASTSLVLTPIRIYGNGRTFTAGSSSKTRVVAELTNLSSISMEHKSKWLLLVVGFILMAITFVMLLAIQSQILSYFLAPLFLIGSSMIVIYFITRQRFLVLNFSGHPYYFSMSGVPENEVLAFTECVISVLGQRKYPQPTI